MGRFLNVWKSYVKKKYRESIRRWDTETGLGGGDHSLFGNFCKNDRWLSWIYQLDRKSDYLLWCSAHGSTPSGVGIESGFEEDSIDVDGSDSALASASHSAPVATRNSTKYKEKKREMQLINENLESSKKCLEAIGDVTTTLKDII